MLIVENLEKPLRIIPGEALSLDQGLIPFFREIAPTVAGGRKLRHSKTTKMSIRLCLLGSSAPLSTRVCLLSSVRVQVCACASARVLVCSCVCVCVCVCARARVRLRVRTCVGACVSNLPS